MALPSTTNFFATNYASHSIYRFVLLFFNCMLTFGSYFCFDMPSVLQDKFQKDSFCPVANGTNVSSINETCCSDCLGMSPENYNLLYAIYAWTNAVVVICAGFLIDKVGNTVGLFLFSGLCVLGSSTFAAGAMLRGTSAMLPLMLTGRLLFGSGNGSLTIVQNRITAFWFRDKELALAFGITLTFSRLGSVLNFFLTANVAADHGLTWTLWGGALLCGIGFLSAMVVSFLDTSGVKALGEDANMKIESKKLKLTDIKHFTLQYWLLTLTIMFFYNGIFPFVADASKFIQDKYQFGPHVSSYIAGAVYDVSMIISPALGAGIDYFGMRGFLALGCAVFTIPVFGLLAFSNVYPLVSTLWLGFTYSIAAASMWPSIPLVVRQATVGTAMGFTTSLQMIGIGISNVIVGQILGEKEEIPREDKLHRWKFVMLFMLANTIACVTTATLLNIIDRRRTGVLNESRARRLRRQTLESARGTERENTSGGATYDSEPSETDPLIAKPEHSVNA